MVTPIEIVVEVERSAPFRGRVLVGGRGERPFTGWLGFNSAIDSIWTWAVLDATPSRSDGTVDLASADRNARAGGA